MSFSLLFTKTKDVTSPVRGHDTDAGIDFFIPNDCEDKWLEPGEDVLVNSGIKVIIPKGYALIFKEKSGIATKRKLAVGAAVVDSDYRGEVHFHLINIGNESVKAYSAGDKIIQGLVVPISLCSIEEISTTEYDKDKTIRDIGGFGSTGV